MCATYNNKSSSLIVMIVKECFMRFHIESYLTSIIAVIVAVAVMLSPNASVCTENMDAESEPDEICCVQSRRDEAEIMLPESSNPNVIRKYHYQRASLSSIIHSSRTSAHGFSVLYCIFRE